VSPPALTFKKIGGTQVLQDEVLEVGQAYQLAAGNGRTKGALEPQQRTDLLGLMTELCKLQQEAACRAKALETVSQRTDHGDLPALYEEEVSKAMKKQKPLEQVAEMKKFENKLGSGASAAADEEDSDDDLEMETAPGGDPDREFKCPFSGYFVWLEDPMRNAGCSGGRACVYSKKAITAHFKKGPNQGHAHPRCPIQGCNAFIKSLSDLTPDRDMAKKVKQAMRSAERREAAAMDDDDAVDMTQS